jgi:hypothetical protein
VIQFSSVIKRIITKIYDNFIFPPFSSFSLSWLLSLTVGRHLHRLLRWLGGLSSRRRSFTRRRCLLPELQTVLLRPFLPAQIHPVPLLSLLFGFAFFLLPPPTFRFRGDRLWICSGVHSVLAHPFSISRSYLLFASFVCKIQSTPAISLLPKTLIPFRYG